MRQSKVVPETHYFEVSLKHPNGDVEEIVGYARLELMEEVSAGDISVKSIGLY